MTLQLRERKISAGQLAALLIFSRLFILLIYVPNTHNAVVGTPALVGIVLGGLLSLLLLLPLDCLTRRYPGMDLYEIARQLSPIAGKAVAVSFYLCCLLLSSETAAQFSVFLTSAVYPRASVFWVSVIFCLAALYMAYLGLEAVTRASGILLVSGIVASVLIGFGLWRFVDTLNLITPFYDGWGPVLRASFLYFTQNLEFIAFSLLLSKLNSQRVRGAFLRYHLLIAIILLVVGFVSITVLGSYGQTRNFPIYTLFMLSGSSIFYRFDFVLVAIWTAAALTRSALYLILSNYMLDELTGRRFGRKLFWPNIAVIFLLALAAGTRMKLFQVLYRLLASGVPVCGLVVLLPALLLLANWRKKIQEKGEEKNVQQD